MRRGSRLIGVPLLLLALAGCGTAGATSCPTPLPADVAPRASCPTQTVTASGRTYAPGDPMTVTVTAVNLTTSPCGGPRDLICGGPALAIQDAGGRVVWSRHRPDVMCAMMIRLLQPGESQEYRLEIDPGRLSNGTYSLLADPSSGSDFGIYRFRIC